MAQTGINWHKPAVNWHPFVQVFEITFPELWKIKH
jgi:hypothetical protein